MLVFIDTEVNSKTQRINDIGCIRDDGSQFHGDSIDQLIKFVKKVDYFVGHNIINHDLRYLAKTKVAKQITSKVCIDTLFLSTLLFPEKPYHALVKDDKIDTNSINNPLNDALNCQKILYDVVYEFNKLDNDMKDIFYTLLKDQDGFSAFFDFLKFSRKVKNIDDLIKIKFKNKLCENSEIRSLINYHPLELAYALTLINTNDVSSLLPPWVLKNHSYVETILTKIRNTPCDLGCSYCSENLNPIHGLNRYFGYQEFRTFDDVPLQERAVTAALKNESLIAVFPTGGGKSLTFQLPALMSRSNTRGLTVVISPLQSLMKDQVDNLEEKNITAAVTINGLLDPIQKKKAIDRVADGSVSILYIAPESLRSKTIEKLLIGRHIIRFVIDEAHCFSSWGHDFRVDYLYIGDFIKNIQIKKDLKNPIPVSCFTATAKRQVIQDISDYFMSKLGIEMKIFDTPSQRKNLKYKVYEVKDEEKKYQLLRNLIEQEKCPTIVYASRRKTVDDLYKRLLSDQFPASLFHGGMENEKKIEEQDKFMKGEATIMVATSAFGMGVDKKDIGCVIHYDISSSLEDYVQEAGRAGRDEDINANCYVLYFEDDLNKHFELLNNSKLNLKEIQQVWKAIKDLTRFRDNISQSALEIARTAGWDEDIYDVQTRITTAIAALEDSGYLKRGQNSPRIFADSILSKSVIEANLKIDESNLFDEKDKVIAKRIIKKLISSKYKSKGMDEIPESRIDYISDDLGLYKEDVVRNVNLLREIRVLADDKDLYAQIKPNTRATVALKILDRHTKIIRYLLDKLKEEPKIIHIKELNEEIISNNIECTIKLIRTVINYLDISKVINAGKIDKDNIKLSIISEHKLSVTEIERMVRLSEITLEYLHQKSFNQIPDKQDNLVTFSLMELRNHYDKEKSLLDESCTLKHIEQALYYLQKIRALQIEGGFMVIYSPLNIERIIKDNHKQYTKQDYQKLETFYRSKMQQIHIVGEYAKKMMENYQSALQFVHDYFQIDYDVFLNKYFFGNRKKDIERNMSPSRFKQLFGTLTQEQLNVILDKDHKRIAVAAGPGSGKTKLLVHKLASIIYTEDIRQEQLLMLTFSRSAVIEFKHRLYELIGPVAQYVDIKTFHSFCFDILGRVGDLEKTDKIIRDSINQIQSGEVDSFKITKMVLVIDEAQDMNQEEFDLVNELIQYNENLRVIAVGDDDQNIFEFRGSSSQFFRDIAQEEEAFYELSINFRSKRNIVEFSNHFVKKIGNRLKKHPISSKTNDLGTIKVTKHTQGNFILPIVREVIDERFNGTTCVITRTNEQAVLITGLLNKYGLSANLIQTSDDFLLRNMNEVRGFMAILEQSAKTYISEEIWDSAIHAFKESFSNSIHLELCIGIFQDFKIAAGKMLHLTDFKEYINDSNLSDFVPKKDLLVSTFHKAKGKEFDHVIILYDNEYHLKDPEKRQLYVGITRAKTYLSVHTNGSIFDYFNVPQIQFFNDDSEVERPDRLVFQLSLKDVHLGYSKLVEKKVNKLYSGDALDISEYPVLKHDDRKVLKISNYRVEEIKKICDAGYLLTNSRVNYLVFWKDQEDESVTLIALPELTFDLIDDMKQENELSLEVHNNDDEPIKNELEQDYYKLLSEELKNFRSIVTKRGEGEKNISDRTINELIYYLPQNIEQLTKIYGLGPFKISKYGKEIIYIVSKFKDHITPESYVFDKHSGELPHYIKWTSEEESKLIEEYSSGLKISEIAKLHQREIGGINSRIKKLKDEGKM